MSYLKGIDAQVAPAANTQNNVPPTTSNNTPAYAQGATTAPGTEGSLPAYLPDAGVTVDIPVTTGTPQGVATAPAPAPKTSKNPQMLNEPEKRGSNPHMIQDGGKKKAIIIGINYMLNPKVQLGGCINDAHNISDFIREHFNFQDIRLMTDDKPLESPDHPIKENLYKAMDWLVADAKPGDSLFFHFSGHGGQAPDETHLEEDGLNETILPADFMQNGQIIDDELYAKLAAPLPEGVRFTAIFDSCHSGTAMDLPFVHRVREGEFKNVHKAEEDQFKGRHDVAKHNLLKPKVLLKHGKEEVLHQAKKHVRRAIIEHKNETAAVVVMLSGCRDDQTSADIKVNNQATGAMSHAFVDTMRKNQAAMSYVELLEGMREALHNGQREFAQFPQLSYGREMDLNETFTM